MTSVFRSKPRQYRLDSGGGGEEKYQVRTADLISDTHFSISVQSNLSKGNVLYNSLVFLRFPITNLENIRRPFVNNVKGNYLELWLRIGPDDGPFLQKTVSEQYGECFILPRSLIELPTKIQQLAEYGLSETDAKRLLAKNGQSVDNALERWWEEQMGTTTDDPFQTDDEIVSSDESPVDYDSEDEDMSPEMLIQLVNLGFAKEDAEIALVAANYDIIRAVEILSSNVSTHNDDCTCDSCSCKSDEELVERVLNVSEDNQFGTVRYTPEEEILKIVWSVSKYQLDEWLLPFYDQQHGVLVFYLKCCEYTDKVQSNGSTLNIQLDIFRGHTNRQQLTYYGVYLSYEQAFKELKQYEQLRKHYALAKEASAGLRTYGEFKDSWEPQGPNTRIPQENIKQTLEFKIKDVAARAARARLKGVPETRVQRFIDAAMVYINDQIKASGYVQRSRVKLRRQASEGGDLPKIIRQRTA